MPEIRSARPEEAQALAGLIDTAYQPYRDRGIVLPDVSGGLPEAIAAGQLWVLGDPARGVLQMTCTPPGAHLMNIAVSEAAKGQGIGGRLIRFAIAEARGRGCSELALATHRDIPENVALYEHLGWRVTAREGVRVMMTRTL